jgi:uncharacterized protein (DUF427 family)
MPKATWNGAVLAESIETIEIEGNQYFPPDSVNRQFLEDSDMHSTCPWKGEASYYHVVVSNEKNTDAAWYYPHPKDAAAQIKNHIAFWKGIKIS